ncbi:MAG: preprotein translocase subunit SecA, partial [Phenylobacterium zucineum]
MALFAQVAIDSALPQLDRYFDYAVPEALQAEIRVGQRVRVPFGRAKSLQDAFVVGLSDTIDYQGKLGEIDQLVSPAVVLDEAVLALCRAVADRQAATLADTLTTAIPPRSVAVEKKWLESLIAGSPITPAKAHVTADLGDPLLAGDRTYLLVEPRGREVAGYRLPVWALEAIRVAAAELAQDKSAILIVP